MKTILSGLAAVSMLAAGAPATAQNSNGGYQSPANANGNIAARIEQLRARLQAGVQSGAITRTEAQPLRQQLRDLTRLERQYSVNGLTGQERADLQQRLRSLRQQLRTADGGRGRYGDDRYEDDGYAQSTQDYDQDGDGYDDRYEEEYQQPAQRGGLGGIIDGLLGRGSTAELRVGQRAPSNLGGVPYAYRNQYRDGNGVYYRSDGQRIYQIDARTQTVVRVYGLSR